MGQVDLALQAIEFSEVKVIARSSCDRQGFVERAQGCVRQAGTRIALREQASEPATGEPGILRLISVEARAHFAQPLLDLPKLGQRPSMENRRLMLPVQEAVFGRNRLRGRHHS